MACQLVRQFSRLLNPLCLEQSLVPCCSARHTSSQAKIVVKCNDYDAHSERQPREVCASMRQVKTSPMKLNLVAKLIRGMNISDALAQMKFCEKKAANFVETTLLDAQRRAEQTFDLDPLNLYVAESYVGKGTYLKRIRYHGRGMAGLMYKYYAHYFLKLREGPPPPKKKRRKEDHKSFVTQKLIKAGPRGIPNSL